MTDRSATSTWRTGTLQASGFVAVAVKRSEHPYYDLWALATVALVGEAELRVLAGAHFPE